MISFPSRSSRIGSLPPSALALSLAALAVPSLAAMGSPSWMEDTSAILIWMAPLLPAFLLAYYRGWAGAALALATGMAALAVAQAVFLLGNVEPPDWQQLLGVVSVYLLFAFGIGILAEGLHRERDEARELALTDALTGLPNRRHAEGYLEGAFARAIRGTPLAVVIFDLDHFKNFNDRWGHSTGDAVLAVFGSTLRGMTRRADLSARLGGEEFLSILNHADARGARIFAERVRDDLGATDLPWGKVTVSAGIAVFEAGMGSPEILLAAADRALYAAKGQGRDGVEVATATGGGSSAPPPSPGESAPPGRTRKFPSFSVTVVDDDPSVAQGLSQMLTRMGYHVSAYQDPREFLMRLGSESEPPDLLLTDVVMPGMNGLTLVEEVGRKGFFPPVILMSGFLQGEVTWPGIPDSVVAFLEKPIEVDRLRKAVHEILSQA